MIAVVQRVTEAAVRVDDEVVGAIGPGLVALVAVCGDDTPADVDWTARKLAGLRIFPNGGKHFDLDVSQAGGSMLLVSNFTVAAATRQGRRPSFEAAADAQQGADLFAALVAAVRALGVRAETGRFRADMRVSLVNDGPVTVIVDSSEAR
ncbi:MAG TPA: D-aminoacyl-tRNA deacylase [Tepidisphaeraceae bacterium]